MDHVPTPPNPTYSVPEVPFLGGIYDGWDFKTYPEEKGWRKVTTMRSSFLVRPNGYTQAELAQFVQEWLFFGLFIELLRIYDVDVDVEQDFLRREGDRVIVTTARLESYLDRMILADMDSPAQERLARVIRSSFIFDTARKFAVTIASTHAVNRALFPPDVALSIIVLGATPQGAVQFLAKDVMPLQFDKMHPEVAVSLLGFETMPSVFIREKLTRARWCRSEIHRLEVFLDVRNLLYVSMLQRPLMKTDHDRCSKDICLAYAVDEASYETKHVSADCRCSHVGPDSRAVAEIYERHGVPAVKVPPVHNGQPLSIDVVDAVATRESYIAISHVWADGLGNPQSNTLPECQVKKLLEIAGSLRGSDSSHAIWMDTLCVPLERQARKLAIASMADIYRQAKGVVVLDAELQQVSTGTESHRIMLQVGICAWAKRLWTLQEGVFASDVHFRLRDGFVNSTSLQMMEEIRVIFNPHLWRPSMRLREFYSDRVPSDFSAFGPMAADAHPIIRWSMSLMFRATSKQMDETVCLASLAGLDVSRLLKHDTLDERVREFFCMVGEIPAPVLFLKGDRVQIDGFRWAPRSLLSFSSSLGGTLMEGDNLTQMGLLGPQRGGLRVTFPGFMISIQQGISLPPDDSVARFYAWIDHDGDEASILLRFNNEEDRDDFLLHEKLALVMEKPLSEMPSAFLATIGSKNEDQDEAVNIDYLFPVIVSSRMDISNAVRAIDGRDEVSLGNDPFPHVGKCTEELSPDQSWSVS
jgi:Heterokaryon incompatibility protein (HET)